MRILSILLAAHLVGACCTSAPESLAPPAVGTGTTPATAGLAQSGRIVNMGQPTAEQLRALAAEGWTTVLDMRTEGEDRGFDEVAVAQAAGMTYTNLGFRAPESLTPELLEEALAVIGGTTGPVLLHCKSGNRSAAVWLAWRVKEEGIPFDQALPEARAMGLRNEAYAEQVRKAVAR